MASPKNVASIVDAVIAQLTADPTVAKLNPRIDRSTLNEDPSVCPWVCVYRFGVDFKARTLGAPANRRQTVHLAVAVQQSDPQSGENCEARLEELLQAVIGAVLADPTLRGTVVLLDDSFNVQYPDYSMKNGYYMQTAYIQFAAITVVQ